MKLKIIMRYLKCCKTLVERDLRIYIEHLGHLYHFRDNVTGLEVDSILEFPGGDYAAVEIKLGYNEVEEAKKSLLKFSDNMITKPKFMCVITGNFSAVVRSLYSSYYCFKTVVEVLYSVDNSAEFLYNIDRSDKKWAR